MLYTDYLVVGAGAASMAFCDTLITELANNSSDGSATQQRPLITIVDKHVAPGGHWNDAYPNVRLHQASLVYGVSSKQLEGNWAKLVLWNGMLPWHHRANKQEILSYYSGLMDDWVSRGVVQYFPESEIDFEKSNSQNGNTYEFRSCHSSGDVHRIQVAHKFVDGTSGECKVPSVCPPGFDVGEGVNLVTPTQLFEDFQAPSGWFSRRSSVTAKPNPTNFVAMDTVVYLQRDMKIAPERIRWIVPNDMWMLGLRGAPVDWAHALLKHDLDVDKAALAMEDKGSLQRVDTERMPTKFRYAIVQPDELKYLRKVKAGIVRHGRVQRIALEGDQVSVSFEKSTDRLVLANDTAFVHCTSPGPFNGKNSMSLFPDANRINLWMILTPPVPISQSCLAVLEAGRRKGTLDLEFGRKLVKNTNAKDYEVLDALIKGMPLQGDATAVPIGQVMTLLVTANFLALVNIDPLEAKKWKSSNRLSMFYIPGYKGRVYENVQLMIEKEKALGWDGVQMDRLKLLEEKLRPLAGA